MDIESGESSVLGGICAWKERRGVFLESPIGNQPRCGDGRCRRVAGREGRFADLVVRKC